MNNTIITENQNEEALAQAEKITELLKDEQYIYQGKVYSYKALYKTSSLKTIIFVVYALLMLIGVLGVVWWTYLKPIGIGADIRLPSFLLGESVSTPVVQVRSPQSPVKTQPAATSTPESETGQAATTTITATSTLSEPQNTATTTTATTTAPEVGTTTETIPKT